MVGSDGFKHPYDQLFAPLPKSRSLIYLKNKKLKDSK